MVSTCMGKTVLITGGTGFIGRKLTAALLARGDAVVLLTRSPERAKANLPKGARAAFWDPLHEGEWLDEVGKADAVVHLAGEPVAQRWTEETRRTIVESRVNSTRLVVEGMARAKDKPKVFVCASAIGLYGARPSDEALDETAKRGEGFLADVVAGWEAEAEKAEALGVRTVRLRIGIVLGEGGGPLEKMILPFKMFAGGPIGDGKQVMSWVHAEDIVGLVLFALDKQEVKGPINAVAPNAATGNEMAEAIGRAMHRPSWFRTPAVMVKVALGEAAEVVTTGQRVVPTAALRLGYAFRYPELGKALESILRR